MRFEPLEPRLLLSVASLAEARAVAPHDCHAASLGDINCDGAIDRDDLLSLAGSLGFRPAQPAADLDADGRVTIADLRVLASNFGRVAVSDGAAAGDPLVPMPVDDAYLAAQGQPLHIAPSQGTLANDLPAAGDHHATLRTAPAHGELAFFDDGSFSYTADAGFVGVDHFTYSLASGAPTGEGPLSPTAAQGVVLVPLGATWRYLDDGSDQGVAWREADFDDATWQAGPAILGYGNGNEATVINGKLSPGDPCHFVTEYFRHEFFLDGPLDFAHLLIELLVDDGGAIYLNGQELVREVLEPDAAYDRLATQTIGVGDETNLLPYLVPAAALRQGRNVLAAEVHQVSICSSDLTFDMRLTALRDREAFAPLMRNDTWRYLDNGSDQGTAWRQPLFDDATWSTGVNAFGFGFALSSPGITTTLSFGPDRNNKFVTSYFRKTFTIDNLDDIALATLDYLYTDGVAIYLNGQQIVRVALPVDAAYNTLATNANNASLIRYRELPIDLALLREGANVLAAEVHNRALNDPNQFFDALLTFTRQSAANAPPPTAAVTIDVLPALPGDVNGDSVLDDADIDLLHANLGSGERRFDLNDDQLVNHADADVLVIDLLGTRYGDVNLDRRVNISDLSRLAANFGQTTAAPAWSCGDLDGDGVVDITDLSRLAGQFGFAGED